MKTSVLVTAAALAGCLGSPMHIADLSRDEMATLSPTALCNAFDWAQPGSKEHAKLIAELERRKAGGATDIRPSRRPPIKVHMSEPVMDCYAELGASAGT